MGIKIFQSLTAEPVGYLYYFAYGVYTLGAQKLLEQKTCFPDAEPLLDTYCANDTLRSEASDMITLRSVLREALPPFVLVVAGAWRDWTGLAFPLLALSISGLILAASVSLISAYIWSMSPLLTTVLESLFAGVGGGWQLFHLSVFCYLSNRTSAEERTARFTWLMVFMTAGTLTGNYVSGTLLTSLHYRWFFIFIIAVKVTAITVGYIFLKEKRRPPPEGKSFLNLKKFLVPFNTRGYCIVNWIMIFNSWLLYCASVAEGSVRLLFAEKQFPNDMNVTNFGYYMAYCIAIHFLGLLLYPPLLIKWLKMSDFTVTIISLILYSISYAGIGISENVVEFYLFSTLNPMKNGLIILHRSILTKCVCDSDLGIYSSFIGVGEGFIPLGTLFLYNYIFKKTMSTWPGAYHLVSTSLGVVMLVNMCIATFLYKRQCCTKGDCNKGCKCAKALQEDQVLSDIVKIQPEI
ncbi:probable peptidoglycan muropeptide transporter SLC46 [Halyomorpha halys]|uniref:probable peptidoglycan muropeptide transporter SLC46 n=1 Tax=Halyomorpha halys TaxID=286706 RepID=UPI0006D4CF14|nr:uncharacterized protein LOC106681156 [Halyomorpha halys]